ncbi:MAG: glycosyltransferase, partial [Candidatus Dormibacteraeota bacterium]|nr:glycosyltransferase [Candidatus Dormibacteraeota bacterium]
AWCRAFATHPGAGIGFGQVSCPPFDPARGYTAGFNVRAGTHGIELFRLGAGQVGMGANMALPRRVWQQLGGFDEGLGAGARFVSAEDSDFAYRAARAGYRILHLREARVWHHGYREGAGASRLMRGYVAGIGAMYAKHARCGDPVAIRLLATDLAHHVANVSRRLPARARPLGLGGLLFYLRGILASWRCRVDRARRLYAA